jgi:nucleoporin NUP42
VQKQSRARAGADQHDALLPADYLALLPAAARAAFEAPAFAWGGVPEMVPPIELR